MLRVFAVLLTLLASASAQDITLTGVGGGGNVASTYVGPGDVVTGAVSFYGLRAYSRATVGGKLANIRRASDNTTLDIVSTISGAFDTTTATTFCNATTCFIHTLYDQVSTANATQANTSLQPQLVFNCFGSNPCITNNHGAGGATDGLQTGSFSALTQPVTFSTVGRWESAANFASEYDDANGFIANDDNSTTDICILAASGGNEPCENLAFGATSAFIAEVQAVFQGPASSVMNIFVNGTGADSAGLSTNSTGGTARNRIFFDGTNGVAWHGSLGELGIWNSAFSHTQRTNMCHNQVAFWGNVDACA